MGSLGDRWRAAFLATVQRHRNAGPLRDAALQGRLGAWTRALTGVAVATCEALGWQASAKGHGSGLLPVARSEYLSLDVIAFGTGEGRWRSPVAAMELENSRKDERIAYSLWKVLCVTAELRVVFCYRQSAEERAALLEHLGREVVDAVELVDRRARLAGQTLVAIGTRDDAATVPYGFFKWYQLETNTGVFETL